MMNLSFREYLIFAERMLRLAEEELEVSRDANWLLIPATILAWSAIESFVNNRLDDLTSLPEELFQLHERAFLLEKRLRFVDSGAKLGQFVLEGTEFRRLEDKIFFLIAKFGNPESSHVKGQSVWQDFQRFKETRDAIIHPRRDKEVILNVNVAWDFLETSKQIIQLISTHIWNKKVEF